MSLSDADARGMAVKMLSEFSLKQLHEVEEQRGVYFLPYEIAAFSKKGKTIRGYWGIPEAPDTQREHAERIGGEIRALMQRHKVSNDLSDHETRCNYDWHIFRSGIDFSFQRGATLSRQAEHDPFTGGDR